MVFVFLTIASSLLSQPEEIAPVDVVAPRPSRELSAGGSAVEFETQSYRGRFQTLDEILERAAGVRVQRYGGLGSYTTLSIRGSNANQVNVYLDGIPLNTAQSAEVNLSDFNADQLQSIQVYRSGAPGEFSRSGIGGAVNLVPFKGEGQSGVRLTGSGGSYGTYHLQARAWDDGGESQKPAWSVGLGYQRSDQDFRFRNNNGTPVINTSDDFDDIRQNAQFRDFGATGYVSFLPGSSTEFKLLNDYRYRLHGVPGPGNNQTEKTEREFWRNTTGIGTDSAGLLIDELRLKTRAFYTEGREQFFDPRQEFSFGSPNASTRYQSYGAHLIPELYLLDYYQILRPFVAVERETFQRVRRDRFHDRTDTIPRKFRSHTTLALQDEIGFFDRRLLFIPGIRHERYVDRFNDPAASGPATFEPNGHRALTEFTNAEFGIRLAVLRDSRFEFYLRGQYEEAQRVPTFFELFGEQGSVIGNTELLPERSRGGEFGPGATIRTPDFMFSGEVVAFAREVEDMILFVPNSQFSLRPENVDSAEIAGAEGSARISYLDTLDFQVDYTYQRAVNTSEVDYLNGNYLPLRPLHEFHTGLDLTFEHWAAGSEGLFVGAVFKDRTNETTNYEASRWIFNAHLSYSFFGRSHRDQEELLATIEVKNIMNTRVSDIVGFPLPGRTVYGTLTYRF